MLPLNRLFIFVCLNAFLPTLASIHSQCNELSRLGSNLAENQTAEIYPTLKRDSEESRSIKILQSRLNQALEPSPQLEIDGSFGELTEAALKRYQGELGLTVDGIAGSKTWQTLFQLQVNRNVKISVNALDILRRILDRAKIETATITSGVRGSYDQARVMYNNIKRYGVEHQLRLYGPFGDQVIETYRANSSLNRAETIAAMKATIDSLGPSKVSKHCSNTHDVFDVAPSSIRDHDSFEAALAWAHENRLITNFITPPGDPAYHLEALRE